MAAEICQMDKRLLIILGVIAAIFIGVAVVSSNSNDNKSSSGGSTNQPSNHVQGQGQSGVKLVEYGDFQCPVCEAYYLPVKQVQSKYDKQIYFQFRNLPLSSIHPNAYAAARAAEAADLQGKYWQMHDMLYESNNWQTWTNSTDVRSVFKSYARQLGLNVEKFKADYGGDKVNSIINADLTAFSKTGQPSSTPTFFLDGKPINNADVSDSNAPSVAKFSKLIDAAIAEKAKQN